MVAFICENVSLPDHADPFMGEAGEAPAAAGFASSVM